MGAAAAAEATEAHNLEVEAQNLRSAEARAEAEAACERRSAVAEQVAGMQVSLIPKHL